MHCALNRKYVQCELEKVKGSIKFKKLKDTSKRYLTDRVVSHTEKLGTGRCAGSISKIDGYKISGIFKPFNYIEVVK